MENKGPELLAEERLAEAFALVTAGWCQGTSARDEDGRAVEPASPAARRWSPVGAVVCARERSSVAGRSGIEAYCFANLALTAAVRAVPDTWNDAPGRRQEEAAEALLRAVSLVRDPRLAHRRRARPDADEPIAALALVA